MQCGGMGRQNKKPRDIGVMSRGWECHVAGSGSRRGVVNCAATIYRVARDFASNCRPD